MEWGLYVTFFSRHEPASKELPPVGPLDNVVLRQHVLVAERLSVQQAQELGVGIDRWLEAELEMQRAIGEEPGGPKRGQQRYSARNGVYVRFAVFGDAHERDLVPELGPFAVVVIGPRSVEADGTTLATRLASELAVWELARGAGDDYIGLHKPDLAFRTANTVYHPSITVARPAVVEAAAPPPAVETQLPAPAVTPPRSEPAFTPAPHGQETIFQERPRKPLEIYSAQAGSPQPVKEPPLTPNDRAMLELLDRERRDETLHSRIQMEERKRLGVSDLVGADATRATRYRPQGAEVAADEEDTSRAWAPALWRMRFAIIGALLVLVAVYGYVTLRGVTLTVGGSAQLRYVSVAQGFNSDRWEYVVNAVQRSASSGTPRGPATYYVVRVAATNRGSDGQQLSPADFTLIDANGVSYAPEGLASFAYESGSTFVWPTAFPVGRPVSVTLVFDLGQSPPRGLLLKANDLPSVRVRLD
jgi:hypothetical protein